ncbi:uncharacterized protein, partial [Temnothorax longispinosus]|uniref:uncharacterized protein n=1 Tax=Temnothorax longispinosus TaxID=300112 RepID=UPI003A98EBCF
MVFQLKEGFYTKITRLYGPDKVFLLKSWINSQHKLCSMKQQLKFLLRCRRWGLFPPHILHLRYNIQLGDARLRRSLDKYKHRCQRWLLNLEIKDINFRITYLRSECQRFEDDLHVSLPVDIITKFFTLNKNKIAYFDNLTKHNLTRKFNNLQSKHNEQLNAFLNINTSKWVINISNKQIPENILKMLSLGSKFGLPVNQHNKNDRAKIVLDVIKNFEQANYMLEKEKVNEVRCLISNSLHDFIKTNKKFNTIDRYINSQFSICNKFLRDNADLLVTNADKGQTTVIMNRNDYNLQMNSLLNDSSTYRKLNKDPIKKITSKLNCLVKSWLNNDIIDKRVYNLLNCTNGNLPRCYGLPKIHKDGYPLRIIVSAIGSPLYNIASYIHNILDKALMKPNSYVKDSWSFVKSMKNYSIPPDYILVSLDVVALFTNIPIELVLTGIEKSEGLRRIFNNYGLSTLYTVPKKLDVLIKKGKDKLEIMKHTGVVYKLDCSDCNACYIGQTKRHLETRVKEHRADINKHFSQQSVVSKHRIDFDHNFKWQEATILHRE